MRTSKRLLISLSLYVIAITLNYIAMTVPDTPAVSVALAELSTLLMWSGSFGVAYVVVLELTPFLVANNKQSTFENGCIYIIRIIGAIGILWAMTG